MRHRIALLCVLLSPLLPSGAVHSAEGFLTRTFGNTERCDARGTLRAGCLFARETLDLRAVLPSGHGDDAVADLFRAAVRAKPEGHDLCGSGDTPSAAEPMSRVGG